MTTGSYSASSDALASLAQTFNVRADVLTGVATAMIASEEAMEAWGWGSAGTLPRIGYIAAAQSAMAAIDALTGALGAIGAAVAAQAQQYGATEDDTAGLFDQIF